MVGLTAPLEAHGEGSLGGMSSAKLKATHICPFYKPFMRHKDFRFVLLGFGSFSELSSMSLNHIQMGNTMWAQAIQDLLWKIKILRGLFFLNVA